MKMRARDGGMEGRAADDVGGGVERNYESLRHRTPSGGMMDAGREKKE